MKKFLSKVQWNIVGAATLLILAVILLYVMCSGTNQAMASIPIKLAFVGEYSYDGENWTDLDERTDLSALNGEVTLRGSFDFECDWIEEIDISLYSNHIQIEIYENSELVFMFDPTYGGATYDMCGKQWTTWCTGAITQEHELEIHLHNLHAFGNRSAYNDFLDSVYIGDNNRLSEFFNQGNRIYRVAGTVIIVVSLILLGVAITSSILHIALGSELWTLGFMSILIGGYIVLDTKDVCMWSDLVVFNTYARQLCIMLLAFFLNLGVVRHLTGRMKKTADMAVILSGIVNGVLIIISIGKVMIIGDTFVYWAVMEAVVSPIMLVCCIYEFIRADRENRIMLSAFALMFVAQIFDLINGLMGWWTEGECVKITFMVLFVLLLVRSFAIVPHNYKASVRANQLSGELQNSRIVLAMSQIRTHFIFNVLNAISGMCKYDPETADETVITFARYLRDNIDIMQEDRLIPFSKELQHVKDYVALEQVRFGDRIRFVSDIKAEDFYIPALVLQPVVENAIKHGLTPKKDGGTVMLRTETDGEKIFIIISDDGVGFDLERQTKKDGVGIENVRFRLCHMSGGTMDINSNEGQGTTVTITIPYKETKSCM